MASVVTVDELVSMRRRRLELDSVARGLRRLGHDVPAVVAAELDALDCAAVEVVIRCLLCGAFGTYPAAVDGDGMPHAAICGDCDHAVFSAASYAGPDLDDGGSDHELA